MLNENWWSKKYGLNKKDWKKYEKVKKDIKFEKNVSNKGNG